MRRGRTHTRSHSFTLSHLGETADLLLSTLSISHTVSLPHSISHTRSHSFTLSHLGEPADLLLVEVEQVRLDVGD